ncbi:MAG TPA: EAL domain-containing protein [Steroidobacteraceae bacterium]|nr:EAL domain-containing protein [Steroidobacteraceae bacterium]
MTLHITERAGLGSILVVDDDNMLRLLIATVLTDVGYNVVTAEDGAQALEVFAEHNIDCVITDVMMPKMNGFELTAAIRIMPGGERVQILFMTGVDDYDSIQRAYEAGANDFALKRINPSLLVERVRFLFKAQQMQDALRLSEQRLSYAQRLAQLGHWERTLDGKTVAVSPVVCALLEVGDGAGLTWDTLCEKVHPDDLPMIQRELQQAIAQHTVYRFEHRFMGRKNVIKVLRHQGEVVATDVPGQWVVRSTLQDVTERRAQEDRLHFLAFHDPLTSLPNRELALRALDSVISDHSREHQHIAVFAVGLDDFSRINSSLGQAVGDTVLKTVGDRLRAQVRDSDHVLRTGELRELKNGCLVARTEGDRFLCVVTNLQLSEAAISIAKRLQRAVASPLALGDAELTLSSTIGVSLYPHDGLNATELIDHAFAALLHAKGQKGSCQFFAAEISDRARQRLTLETELRHALEERQFELFYQPRLQLADNRVHGAEALVRWRHPARGMVSPADFIPLMEDMGLITALGNQVIDMVAQQVTHWARLDPDEFRVSFNISPLQFLNSDVVAEVDAALKRHHGLHKYLEVEITESALLSQPELVSATLQAFRERGIRVALDDFGTGFSSLSYLRKLPLDVLKIDRSFISDIGVSHSGTTLVDAMLFIAQALGLDCVAEGVELETQLSFLASQHCKEVQGYLIARPMPAGDFLHWRQKWNAKQCIPKTA